LSDRLGQLTRSDFAAHLNEPFRVWIAGATHELLLVEANALAAEEAAPTLRAPFSLVFSGPRGAALAQQIHRLEHSALGALELFLVPIEPDAVGLRYEAIFG
jgi:hypothetical protein